MIKFYTDGAANIHKENDTYVHGDGGAAIVVVENNTIIFEDNIHFKKTTNNHCELYAIFMALRYARSHNLKELEICSDSSYCVNMLKPGGWVYSWEKNYWTRGKKHEPIENLEIIKAIFELMKDLKVVFTKVKGHAGDEFNNRADFLAVEGKLGRGIENSFDEILENYFNFVYGVITPKEEE